MYRPISNMHLYTLTIGLVLFPQVYSLECYVCAGGTVCTQMQCSADRNQCGAIRMLTYNGNSKTMDVTTKSCFITQECIHGSSNFGVSREVITSECCNSSLCNNKTPEPPKPKPNGKKCYRCDGNGDCSGTLNCDGDEDMCIKVSVTSAGQTVTKKGCATKSMCSASKAKSSGTISCCEKNYCNDAKGLSASLLVLATMLILIHFLSN